MPRHSTRNPISSAVSTLRQELHDSQRQFARRLHLPVDEVVLYETSCSPTGEVLLGLYKIAVNNNLPELASMFHRELVRQFGGVASYELSDAEGRLVLLLNELQNSSSEARAKVGYAIGEIQSVLTQLDAMNPLSATP